MVFARNGSRGPDHNFGRAELQKSALKHLKSLSRPQKAPSAETRRQRGLARAS
jgi:hypothetical protein